MTRHVAPPAPPRRVLLFFIDGIGVGEDDPAVNPLAAGDFPTLRLTASRRPEGPAGPPAMAHGLDAALGVPGLPQSATGQTSILTGVNAPAALGRHMSGFPGPTLKGILAERSILKRLTEAGLAASFLNAFGPRFFEMPERKRRLSATTLATMASGRPFRTWEDLTEGRAVVHDLTHWRMREWGYDLPLRSPEEAGAIIARESSAVDFALFEYFETDRAGHAQDRAAAERCLRDLDAALRTILASVDLRETTVIVASDHGNLEDGRVKTHTRNAAFFAAWGVGAETRAREPGRAPARLTDLVPFVLESLGRPANGDGAIPAA
ncbi:MAG: alkaline phosphatase family protein [Hyphomicrobiales bacterium]